MKFEKTQPGNPHCLPIRQHVLPAASIRRFCNIEGQVSLYRGGTDQSIGIPPTNPIFCAMRAWDYEIETGLMKNIEDRFQGLADVLTNDSRNTPIGAIERQILSSFYVLWVLREKCRTMPIEPESEPTQRWINLNVEYTKDDTERLEKAGIGYLESNNRVPTRLLNSMHIKMNWFRNWRRYEGAPWQIVMAKDGEFLVPDIYQAIVAIPLTPTKLIVAENMHTSLTRTEVAMINRQAIFQCNKYVFARDFSCCPV